MRIPLFGLNLIALVTLVVPGLLLLDVVSPALGALSAVYLGAIVLGALCLIAVLVLLGRNRADPANALGLSLVGMALVAAPTAMIYLASLNH
jgi:hypothetical protein